MTPAEKLRALADQVDPLGPEGGLIDALRWIADDLERVGLAERDGEYLNPAHGVIADTLDGLLDFEGLGHDYATAILDALANAGWHLLAPMIGHDQSPFVTGVHEGCDYVAMMANGTHGPAWLCTKCGWAAPRRSVAS